MSRDIFQDAGTAFPWIADFPGPCTNKITGLPVPAGENQRHYFSGITVRDYFAAKALPSLLDLCREDTHPGCTYQEHCAANAYEVADAMLAERAK